ncbi:MAG: DsbA family protein [Anaerolineaceae bacterium]|nr:DsbA family protein [Anaerolineaceae bacterium]
MDKVIVTIFTDPMMGLSYECEPVFRKLETHYKERIEFKYVMGGLVRDVSDFMTPEELSYEPNEGIRRYCLRLADIYRSEESIGGLPINMDGFHLFDAQHRSSYPMNIAFEAAKLTEPGKAEQFLYRLRYAAIVETKQTTTAKEILYTAEKTGLNISAFTRALHNDTAEAAFQDDLSFKESLRIHGLPAYLIQYKDKATLVKSLIGYDDFAELILYISDGKIKPENPESSIIEIEKMLNHHPLISRIELMTAFDLSSYKVEHLLAPCLSAGRIRKFDSFYEMVK